ncbi:PEP-CTERM sorting domain-containing protein [Massilia antarctica]|uniref:PEP-CTERM sorting domain-containing protein n=2 Tax=Massilia antarctica TaxID=2765360 RepID=A0AA48WCF3_9BURK|nr:PEP-CTERM sorting domain-containing protein [Massilia antarctica]QPI50040.1 PEP-CTERM sorting domain-containing protein [Massilia antarctica]
MDRRTGTAAAVYETFRLYENGVLRDLNTLIDPAFGWVLQEARAINDMQQIAATGCKGGQCYALRLDPTSAVPEPDTYAVLLLGLVMVGFAARRAAGVGANRTVSSSARQGGTALPFAR